MRGVHAEMKIICLSLTLILCFGFINGKNFKSAKELEKEADEALALGKYNDALILYSDAINTDSDNPVYFMKRSSIYLQTKKYREALLDVNRVIMLDPNRINALYRRGLILFKVGKFQESKEDISKFLKYKPQHNDALKLIAEYETASSLEKRAFELFLKNSYKNSIIMLTKLLELAPNYEKALEYRANSYYNLGEIERVLEDSTQLLKISKKNGNGLYLRGKALLLLDIQNSETSKYHWKQCLMYESSNENCKVALKELDEFERDFNDAELAMSRIQWKKAADLLEKCLKNNPQWYSVLPKIYKNLAKTYLELKDGKSALDACNDYIKYDERDPEIFVLKGKSYILLENWDLAVQEMDNAINVGGNKYEYVSEREKAVKLRRRATRKNYYKILGVDENCTKREINKAYRKMSKLYHPDKNTDKDSQKNNQIYADIVEAHDILSDDEKRRRYDNDESFNSQQQDPFDPFTNIRFHWN